MVIDIREATEADLERLEELYQQMDPGAVIDRERLHTIFSRLREYPHYRVFVANAEGTIAGTYSLLIMHTLGSRCAPAGIVEDVVVDEAMRGRGIGGVMMRDAMQRCRDAACYKLVLSSNDKRQAAHRFYESLGFAKHGTSFMVEL
jgi:GNAT superfamily N-acetyltransferase